MPDFSLERQLWQTGITHVVGIDEAGRGPLAGPVAAAAVVLPQDWPSALPLADSKKLSAPERQRLALEIKQRAHAWSVRLASAAEIDRLNILQATLQAMSRAVSSLSISPSYALVDGNRSPILPCACKPIVKGDDLSNSIAAASILAKTTRDQLMQSAHHRWPQWNFAQHKGYPTPAHRQAILDHGPSPIHRVSFLKKLLQLQAPQHPNQMLARQGENQAAAHLISLGYRIRARNVYLAGGELDLIAEKDDSLVFVEVKTRKPNGIHPSLSVTSAKQAQLRKLGESYLEQENLWDLVQPRFDVITVQISPHKTILEHFPNAC